MSEQPTRIVRRPVQTVDDPNIYKNPMSIRSGYRPNQHVQVVERGDQRLVIHQGMPRRKGGMLYAFLGGLTMFLLMFIGSVGWNWGQGKLLDFTYGYPRTWQTDQVVGHNDSATNPSHFFFVNLHGKVEIIEMSGGDPGQSHIYPGPTIVGDNGNTPVTGEFKKGDNGYINIIVHIGDQEITFINDGKEFKGQK